MTERFDVIPYEDLSNSNTWINIGRGSFGSVWVGRYLGLQVAIKEVLYSNEYDVDKYFRREVKIMQESRHPNIVLYLGICLAPKASFSDAPADRQRILIISEFLEGGNVRSYIASPSLPFPWRLRLSFAVDIARAVAYMHARKCMHRDLKPENLLLTSNMRVKVCDFGFARIAARNPDEMKRLSYCGTDGYMSPEILMGIEFGLETDIFSLGIILCEILSREFADSDTFKRVLPNFGIDADEVRERASLGCPADLADLAIDCCHPIPANRPTIREVLDRLQAIELDVLALDDRTIKNPSERTYNIGSMRFGGLRTRKQVGRSTRPGRIPSFEGQIQVPSSFNSDDSDDETIEAALKLFDDLAIDAGRTKYSATVIGRGKPPSSSLLTVKASNASSLGSGFPILPSEWLVGAPPSLIAQVKAAKEKQAAAPANEASSSEDESLPRTPEEGVLTECEARSTVAPSFVSATTAIGHGEADDAEEETTDHFFLAPSRFDPAIHRFSLAKPGWRLFSTKTTAAAVNELRSQSAAEDAEKTKKTDSAGVWSRCHFCEKRLGLMKTFMTCDDCGMRVHIKCADVAPRTCTVHHELPASTPAVVTAPSTPNKRKPSRLVKHLFS